MVPTLPPHTTEKSIVKHLHSQEPQSIPLIDKHYQMALFGVIFRIVEDRWLAETAWQESLVSIWRSGHGYDPEKERLFTWLLRISRKAAHATLQISKQNSSNNGHHPGPPTGEGVKLINAPGVVTYKEKTGIKEVVEKLAPAYKEPFELLFFQGCSQDQVAKDLQLSTETVKTRARQGVNILRKWLSN